MPEHHSGDDRRGLGNGHPHGRVPYTSPFTLVGRLRSFRNAAKGAWFVLRSQHNAWVHAAATAAVLGLGTFLHVTVRPFTLAEWCALVIAIATVWVAETFNTGLEVLAEAITQERHPVLKVAKDVAAAAVLIAAIGAAIVGAILFVPPIVELVKRCG
jgi:diacylglycerol kinase (ATP)